MSTYIPRQSMIELKGESNALVERTRQNRRSLTTRIRLFSVCALVIGTILISGAFGFLSFLWWSNSSNEIWRRIVVNGWATRSVTVASLVIRTSMAAQAFVCTAMLAALTLHWGEVPLPAAAAVSLLRFSNAGPSSLILPLFDKYMNPVPSAGFLVFILTLVGALSNITSTALLSGLKLGLLPGNKQFVTNNFGANESQPMFEMDTKPWKEDFWTRRLDTFPSFAESQAVPPMNRTGVHNTGVQLRGLLPIAPQELRSNIRYFSGVATVMAMRTICARPKISTNVYFDPFTQTYSVNGTAWLDLDNDSRATFENYFIGETSPSRATFNCLLPSLTWDKDLGQWHILHCN